MYSRPSVLLIPRNVVSEVGRSGGSILILYILHMFLGFGSRALCVSLSSFGLAGAGPKTSLRVWALQDYIVKQQL